MQAMQTSKPFNVRMPATGGREKESERKIKSPRIFRIVYTHLFNEKKISVMMANKRREQKHFIGSQQQLSKYQLICRLCLSVSPFFFFGTKTSVNASSKGKRRKTAIHTNTTQSGKNEEKSQANKQQQHKIK